jgi:hypothetical protein
LPKTAQIIELERQRDWSCLAGRGMSEEDLAKGFPDYVQSGERTFRAEVILTTRADLVESEFGNAIHEARIIEQRQGAPYAGRIASNASFIITHMLMLALSPTIATPELPVKMWGRYLPDVYSVAIWKLFGITLGRDQVDSLVPWSAELQPG